MEKGMSERLIDNAWEGMVTSLGLKLPLHVMLCEKCKVPHVDVGRWAKFGHNRHHCHNCANKSHTQTAVVCNVLGAWHPALDGTNLWLDKSAPTEFAGELGEFSAELNVLPNGQVSLTDLFKYDVQASLAETWLREECESTNPVREVAALRTALLGRHPVSTERCPRCAHVHADVGEACHVPSKAHTCPRCTYVHTIGEAVVANPLARFNPMICPSTNKIVLLSSQAMRFRSPKCG